MDNLTDARRRASKTAAMLRLAADLAEARPDFAAYISVDFHVTYSGGYVPAAMKAAAEAFPGPWSGRIQHGETGADLMVLTCPAGAHGGAACVTVVATAETVCTRDGETWEPLPEVAALVEGAIAEVSR